MVVKENVSKSRKEIREKEKRLDGDSVWGGVKKGERVIIWEE